MRRPAWHWGAAFAAGLCASGILAAYFGGMHLWLGAFGVICFQGVVLAVLTVGQAIFGSEPPPVFDRAPVGPSQHTEVWTDEVTGKSISVHRYTDCAGTYCALHKPSEHPMATWPRTTVFGGRAHGLILRKCEHGISHPDPDSVAHFARVGLGSSHLLAHGCDGCCPWEVEPFDQNGPFELPAASLGTAQDEVMFATPTELEAARSEVLGASDVWEAATARDPLEGAEATCVYCGGTITKAPGGWYHLGGKQVCQLREGKFPSVATPYMLHGRDTA